MANYSKLENLLNTIEGMSVLRNNSANDDSVDTVTGVDWFTFNDIVASNIYVSGNSYVGFGSNTEHLKICRRDAKMWYLYRQEGTIGNTKFLKVRWQGYSWFSQTSDTYLLIWELFLFDDGGIYVNLVNVPSDSSYLGTSQLICGSNTYSFTVEASTPMEYSFVPNDSGGFTGSNKRYPIIINHTTHGIAEFSSIVIRHMPNIISGLISWKSEIPQGTSVKVYSKLSNVEYSECKSGGKIQCIVPGKDYSNETLTIKVEMSTEDATITPSIYDILIQLLNDGDDHIVVLELGTGTTTNIQNSIGEVNVEYAGGTLKGEGGMIANFASTFLPKDLAYEGHQNDVEHIEVSDISTDLNLIRVYHSYINNLDHVSVSVSVETSLIHIDDI